MRELKSQHNTDNKIVAMLQSEIRDLTYENNKLHEEKQAMHTEIDRLLSALDKAEDRAARLATMLHKNS